MLPRKKGHPIPMQRILLIFCLLSKMILDERKRVYSTQRPTFVRFLSKDSGTCMIRRVTHYGFVSTSTMMKTLFHS